jgi:hypothetical protein
MKDKVIIITADRIHNNTGTQVDILNDGLNYTEFKQAARHICEALQKQILKLKIEHQIKNN